MCSQAAVCTGASRPDRPGARPIWVPLVIAGLALLVSGGGDHLVGLPGGYALCDVGDGADLVYERGTPLLTRVVLWGTSGVWVVGRAVTGGTTTGAQVEAPCSTRWFVLNTGNGAVESYQEVERWRAAVREKGIPLTTMLWEPWVPFFHRVRLIQLLAVGVVLLLWLFRPLLLSWTGGEWEWCSKSFSVSPTEPKDRMVASPAGERLGAETEPKGPCDSAGLAGSRFWRRVASAIRPFTVAARGSGTKRIPRLSSLAPGPMALGACVLLALLLAALEPLYHATSPRLFPLSLILVLASGPQAWILDAGLSNITLSPLVLSSALTWGLCYLLVRGVRSGSLWRICAAGLAWLGCGLLPITVLAV